MYPMPTPPISPYAPGASFLSQGLLPGGSGNLSQLPLQQGVVGQSGGLLSKLIGGAKAGGGGITSIMNMLQNAQKAIGAVQSFGPIVQQYGPLVKSLPALISAMRGSGNSDDESADGDADETKVGKKDSSSKDTPKKTANKTQSKKNTTTKKSQSKTIPKKSRKKSTKEISKGVPAPKLYI